MKAKQKIMLAEEVVISFTCAKKKKGTIIKNKNITLQVSQFKSIIRFVRKVPTVKMRRALVSVQL